MDPIGVLPNATIKSNKKYSTTVVRLGITTLAELAKYLLEMPYGFIEEDEPLASLGENRGTCVHKHGIYAAVAQENNVKVTKCNGFYKLTPKIVPRISQILVDYSIDWIPATHCFLSYGLYRIDLTEGNCNGKSTALDSYLAIYEVPYDFSIKAANIMYKEFLLNEFPKWDGSTHLKTVSDWEKIYSECCNKLKLSIACSI